MPHAPGTVQWIVVGAGTAGSVVAARLAAAGHRVTVVEAGPGRRGPAGAGSDALAAMAEPERTWPGIATRRPTGTGEGPAPTTRYLQGRGVGGSSAINAMVAMRPDDAWLEAHGLAGTTIGDIGLGVAAADDDELSLLDRAVLADRRGHRVLLARRSDQRVTSFGTFLEPLVERGAVALVADDTVVGLDHRGGRVHGVRCASGRHLSADAVVVCAGAIGSPRLLLAADLVPPGPRRVLDHPSLSLTIRLWPAVAPTPAGLLIATGADLGDIDLLALRHLGPGSGPHAALVLTALRWPSVDELTTTPERSVIERRPPSPEARVALTDAVAEVREMLHAEPFRAVVDDVLVDDHGTRLADVGDEAIGSLVASATAPSYHAAGTLTAPSVTPSDDADGWGPWWPGVDGLAVVDASRFRSLPAAHPMIATLLLAQRWGAELAG